MNIEEKTDLEQLYENIGYRFKSTDYLAKALTHSSYANELKTRNVKVECNERLEFLGDSVLSILVSEYIFLTYENLPEGELTRIRASVVCEAMLSELAKKIHLGDFLLLGHGEEHNNGRSRKSILADAFEALLAAIFIDGGKKAASDFLMPLLKPEIAKSSGVENNFDYKTALQQFVQETPGEVLEYVLISEEGPNHDKIFHMEARLDSNTIGKGCGKNKREAEQRAAHEALVLFGVLEK